MPFITQVLTKRLALMPMMVPMKIAIRIISSKSLVTNGVLGLTLLLLSSGCSNKIVIPEQACLYKDGSQAVAPNWVCKETTQADQRFAVGYAAPSMTGAEFSQKMAFNAASIRLMRSLWQDLQVSLERWLELQRNQTSDTTKATAESSQKVTTDLYLSLREKLNFQNFKQINLVQAEQTPSGGMAVLIELDRIGLINLLKTAIENSTVIEPQLWQPYIGQSLPVETAIELIDLLPAK